MTVLRLFSINLLVDRAEPADLRRAIVDADPDIVVAQELGPRTTATIAGVLPHGHLEPQKDLFGMGIATRCPVAVERLVLDGRSAWVAGLEPDTWPGLPAPIDIVDVHLLNPVNRPWSVTRERRRAQIAGIARCLEERDAASVVIGDMNASPAWPEYRMLRELGTDAARATGTARRTWSQFLWGPRLLRIDHAFVAGATPIATSTARVRGTDHRALVVDVRV